MPVEKLFTTTEVGALLSVDASSIVKWVNDGLLVAYTTPGGHRRMRASDVVAFLKKHGMFVPPELDGARKRRILFVDDDARVLGAMRRAMKDHAHEVEFLTATSAVDGLVLIGSSRPDVLFLDFAMPDIDGLEMLSRLKSATATSGIDVVLLTGGKTAALERKALALGAKAVVEKPVSAAQLVELSAIRASA